MKTLKEFIVSKKKNSFTMSKSDDNIYDSKQETDHSFGDNKAYCSKEELGTY